MALAAGTRLLNGRYELIGSGISQPGQGELWRADDTAEWGKPFLLKAWPFHSGKPDDVQRALWDSELRTLYRVRSTPGSEDSLLQLHNVGIDHGESCFVMVFKTEGPRTLASVLDGDRSQYSWLSGRPAARRELWQMLGNMADGLALLHDQQVIHRNVSAESVFLEPGDGPESCRLGGFEWSIRLGRPVGSQASPPGWGTPPERLNGGAPFGPDADWFAFGMLAARCMLSIERLGLPSVSARERYTRTLSALERASGMLDGKLIPLESELLSRLIAEDPAVRYRHHSEIATAIREVMRGLRQSPSGDEAGYRHVVMIDPRRTSLVDSCLKRGLRKDLKLDPGTPFDPRRPEHVTGLITFLYKDFREGATLSPVPNRDQYTLSGSSIHLTIVPANSTVTGKPDWQNAYCKGASDWVSSSADTQVTVDASRIEFFSTQDRQALASRLSSSANWEPLLPRIDRAKERREEQERFIEFARITNQIDLLIRDGELFRCAVTNVEEDQDGNCARITVKEVPREHPPLHTFESEGGMVAFLLRETSNRTAGHGEVQLCPPDSESIARPSPAPVWEVKNADPSTDSATLAPRESVPSPRVGEELVLRTTGLRGQVELIRRRKEAIDKRLARHNYLLQSLATPGDVLMDSGDVRLPFPLTSEVVDESKLGQITKILGARPIYALQGPPGTGKTHLVAWLLREILEDDPVAQVLITAQAHPAVDVLRAKVEQEAFKDKPKDERPLAIRLRRVAHERQEGPPENELGSEQQVTRELIENTIRRLEEASGLAPAPGVQQEWLAACRDIHAELITDDAALAKEFRELVKRSASITYSTTGDGDLAALADDVSYDWSIVEEAAKAHGFELALPLCLGHRWLLIGDPKQLSPFRIGDYRRAVANLDATVNALRALDTPGSLLDDDFIRQWHDRDEAERSEFREYCIEWLEVFEKLHKLCSYHQHQNGLLSGQHRMHPDIGELISETYYDGLLHHHTKDPDTGMPRPGILHGLSGPPEVRDRAVVWLDVPAASADPRGAEVRVPRYQNPAEAHVLGNFLRSLRNDDTDHPLSLAVLSPYAQQVGYLRRLNTPAFRDELHAAGLRLAPDPRRPGWERPDASRDGFFTVDSFQGNQAEIIAVSLVRNNTEPPQRALGFLEEAARMNVLISRAERLLVLVGSWDFFRKQIAHVSRDKEQYSEVQHLAWVTDRLEAWFADGRAIRIPADLSGARVLSSQAGGHQ